MRSYFLILFLWLAAGVYGMAAAEEEPTASDEELKSDVYKKVQISSVLQNDLKTQVYEGDLARILTQRIAELNQVLSAIAEARTAAAQLADKMGDPNDIKEAVQQVIREQTKEDVQVKKAGLLDFVLSINELMTDPNRQPDPNDLDEQARMADFELACLDLVTSNLEGLP